MMERFLERIALSRFRDYFILKGGFLIASVVGIDSRSTVDIDTTLKNFPLAPVVLEEIILEILAIDCDDHISMVLKKLETICEEGDYTGIRVYIETTIDRMRIPIKVDITTGDAITPKEIMYSYPLMFEARSISIWAYNLETVLAEKYHGILSFATYNTRMRDYYDMHILLHATRHPIDTDILANAIYQTAKQRQGEHLLDRQKMTLKEIFESAEMKALWQAYQMKNPYAKEFTWEDICQSVEKVMLISSRRDTATITNKTDEKNYS